MGRSARRRRKARHGKPGSFISAGEALPSRSLAVPQATDEATPGALLPNTVAVASGSSNQPRRCAARTSAGLDCRAFPLHGSTRCAFHDPDHRPALLEAAAKGGRSKRTAAIPLPDQPLDLSTRRGIQAAAGHLAQLQFSGRVGDRQLARLISLIATAARTIDPADEERQQMEAVVRSFLRR